MADRPNFGHAGAGAAPDPGSSPRGSVERPMERFLRPQEPAESSGGAAFLQLDTPALMIDLVLANGDRVGLSYAYLTGLRLTDEGTLYAEFGSSMVTIAGRGLLALYQNMLTHQAYRVACAALPFDDASAATWIKSISVSEREE